MPQTPLVEYLDITDPDAPRLVAQECVSCSARYAHVIGLGSASGVHVLEKAS